MNSLKDKFIGSGTHELIKRIGKETFDHLLFMTMRAVFADRRGLRGSIILFAWVLLQFVKVVDSEALA